MDAVQKIMESVLEPEELAAIAAEKAQTHLEANGRIMGRVPVTNMIMDNTIINNASGKIDGARFFTYDPDTKTITIRLDHSKFPEFWAEVRIPLKKLQEWLKIVQ